MHLYVIKLFFTPLVSGEDFIALQITGEFTPDNQRTPVNFTLETIDDQAVEGDEVAIVELMSSDGSVSVLSGAEFTITISDNDSKYSHYHFSLCS